MNPRKFVIAAVALVAMVTVAKYTRGMGMSMQEFYKTPQGQKFQQDMQNIQPVNMAEQNQRMEQVLLDQMNRMTSAQKTAFDNWLRQSGLHPETMTPQQKANYAGDFLNGIALAPVNMQDAFKAFGMGQ
jgi:hypothetical protein